MLQPDLCNYSHAYNDVTERITVTNQNANAYDKKSAFKDNAPFIVVFQKLIIHLLIMAMYSFIEFSKDQSKTSVSLRNYQRHEPNNSAEGNVNHFIKDLLLIIKQVLQENQKLTVLNKEIAKLLKHLSNF